MASGMVTAPAALQYPRERRDRRPPLCAEGSELLWDTQTGPWRRFLGPGLGVQHVQWSHSCPLWRRNSHCLRGGGHISGKPWWDLSSSALAWRVQGFGKGIQPLPQPGGDGKQVKGCLWRPPERESAAVGMCWAASSPCRFPQAARNLE